MTIVRVLDSIQCIFSQILWFRPPDQAVVVTLSEVSAVGRPYNDMMIRNGGLSFRAALLPRSCYVDACESDII